MFLCSINTTKHSKYSYKNLYDNSMQKSPRSVLYHTMQLLVGLSEYILVFSVIKETFNYVADK